MTQRRKISKKWLWIIVGAILVAGIGAGVAVAIANNNDNTGEEEEVVEVEEKNVEEDEESEEEAEEMSQEELEKLEEQGGKQKVVQYDGEDPNNSENLTGVVVYAGTVSDKWMVRVNIDQFLTEGQCELNVYQGGNVVYTETANIMADVSTSTCEGFDVAVSKLPRGAVSVKIKLSSGGKTGIIEGEASI